MLKRFCIRFANDVRGATAIEYALIVAGVAITIVGAVSTLGGKVGGLFASVAAGFH